MRPIGHLPYVQVPARTRPQRPTIWPCVPSFEPDEGPRASSAAIGAVTSILHAETTVSTTTLEELLWTLFRIRNVDDLSEIQARRFLNWAASQEYRSQIALIVENPDPVPAELPPIPGAKEVRFGR